MKSLVLTIPAEYQEAANRIAVALGHDSSPLPGQTFTVGYSADGSAPATHYSARTQADDSFIELLVAAVAGNVPLLPPQGEWADYGLTVGAIADVVGDMMFDVKSEDEMVIAGWSYGDHLTNANENWNLTQIQEET